MPTLPFADAMFDKALAINSFQFWPKKEESLRQLRRVMRPHGLIALAVQPRQAGADDAAAGSVGQDMVAALNNAGFEHVELSLKTMRPVSTACVTATA